MLIVLHIRLFLISYDSGGMSLGDGKMNYDFFLAKLIVDGTINLMLHILDCIPNS